MGLDHSFRGTRRSCCVSLTQRGDYLRLDELHALYPPRLNR